jgi:GNAT superfamily N-acetyltransferase
MDVRELATQDLDALLALYADLHETDEAAPRARLERVWRALVADPAQLYLGAFVDGELVSACNAAIIPNLTRGARPYAVIENVVTHGDHRGRGIGGATLRALVERCLQRDCYKVMLMSAAGRQDAHRFYRRLGFDADSKHAFVIKAQP